GTQDTPALPSDEVAGVTTVIGWNRVRERTTFTFTYTPSYVGHQRYSSLNALNHQLAFSVSRKLTPRLTLTLSTSGDYSSIDQFLFEPTTLSSVASVRTTFDDLASGLLTSRSTNPQLTSILGSATLPDPTLRAAVYGSRMFTTAARGSLSYSYS